MSGRRRWIDRLAGSGILPSDADEIRAQKATLALSSALIGVVALAWAVVYLALGFSSAGAVPLIYLAVSAGGFVHFAMTRRVGPFRITQLTALLVLPMLMQVSLGGFHASSGVILWSLTVPLGALMFSGPRRSIPWFIAYLVVVVTSAVVDSGVVTEGRHVPSAAVVTFFVLNIGGVSATVYLLLHYFVRGRDRARTALDEEHRLLQAEQDKSERLLLNVLPAPIARQLKDTDGVIADRFPEVSVLFADLVGFTALTRQMPAEHIVGLLDELFSAFDGLAERWGIEKIKTIGDAYMAAAGLPTPRPDHARAVAEMALGMVDETARRAAATGWPLAVRIGIDSGPVVAGVIGRRKFIYDLWGETVNTASRMESMGLPGRIQVTGRTFGELADGYRFEERGPIAAKGIGEVRTYLLIGRANGPLA